MLVYSGIVVKTKSGQEIREASRLFLERGNRDPNDRASLQRVMYRRMRVARCHRRRNTGIIPVKGQ